jgi:hypothetical protein
MICGLVADDPDVKSAATLWDRATPATHLALVHARLAAQGRMGIPKANLAPLYSGEVEGFLMPILFRQVVLGNERAVLAEIREELTKLYGVFAETVLTFMLKIYRHGGIETLKQAAWATAPVIDKAR